MTDPAFGAQLTELRAKLLVADRLASLGTLAAGVAHELRAPLASALSSLAFIEEALHDLAGERPELVGVLAELERALFDAIDETQRIRGIVQDLEAFAPSEEPGHAPTELAETLEGALRMTRHELLKRATVTRQYAAVPMVLADPPRLGQVFVNLLLNAAQALDPDRRADNRVDIKLHSPEEGMVCVEIADNGAGIAPDHQARVFDPFFTTKAEGLGLGLSVCHGIVSALGGSIELESQLGVGTVFRVMLPVLR